MRRCVVNLNGDLHCFRKLAFVCVNGHAAVSKLSSMKYFLDYSQPPAIIMAHQSEDSVACNVDGNIWLASL